MQSAQPLHSVRGSPPSGRGAPGIMFPVWEIEPFPSTLSIVAELHDFKATICLIFSIVIPDRLINCMLFVCLFSLQNVLLLISLLYVLCCSTKICLSLSGMSGSETSMIRTMTCSVSMQGRLKELSQFWIEELKNTDDGILMMEYVMPRYYLHI